ncbi:MAG: GAF domain-containing protein, partial [Candidatus Rokubacteria bacterium]|nr:GAF domain-containing protein [Candidatus Rokubacteria bacterium]
MALRDLSRMVASLRQRLNQLGASEPLAADSGRAPDPSAPSIASLSDDALARVADVLSVPAWGLAAEDALTLAVDRLTRLLAADRAAVFLVDPETGHLLPRAARGFRRDDLDHFAVLPDEGMIGRAFREDQVFCYSATGAPPDDRFLARFPVREAIVVPVRRGVEVAGVLYAGRRGVGRPFVTGEALLMAVIGDRVASALSYERLSRRLGAQLARLQEMEALAGQALVGHDVGDFLTQLCGAARRLLDMDVAAIWVREADGLALVASSGLPAGATESWRLDPSAGLVSQLLTSERPFVRRDLEAEAVGEAPLLRGQRVRGWLMLPLRLRREVAGALALAHASPRDFAEEEIAGVQVLATVAALALENDHLYREARHAVGAASSAQDRLAQSDKARALAEMAGGVAHEFNSILAIILGKTQLLLARAPEEPLRESLGLIEEAAWRAADIVRCLQGFSMVAADEGSEAVDLNAVVQDAVALSRAAWKEADGRGTQIDIASDLGEIPRILGGAIALREAVSNLLLNAFDAMPHGGKVSLRTRVRGGGVELIVEDRGEGMSEEVQRRIFDPFFTTRAPVRTGLGMSVVQGIVARHHGRIEVVSDEGHGTTIAIWLPVPAETPVVGRAPSIRPGPPREASDLSASVL